MNSQVTSHVTRRGLLSAAGSASLLALFRPAEVLATDVDDKSPSCKVEASRDWKDVDKDLRRLLPLWQEERKLFVLSSNTADSWQGPHGKAIVALGPAILPALIHELRRGDFFFNVPLALITRIDIANGKDLSEQDKAALWLEWWVN